MFMRAAIFSLCWVMMLFCAMPVPANAASVDLYLSVDDPQIAVGQTTTVRLMGQTGWSHGLTSVAVNVTVSDSALSIVPGSVNLLGSDPFWMDFLSEGTVHAGGIDDLFNLLAPGPHGHGSPVEVLNFQIMGQSPSANVTLDLSESLIYAPTAALFSDASYSVPMNPDTIVMHSAQVEVVDDAATPIPLPLPAVAGVLALGAVIMRQLRHRSHPTQSTRC